MLPFQLRASSQLSNLMSVFVILLCVSQVYASCDVTINNSCPSFPTQTVIGIIVGGIVLVSLVVFIRVIRRRKLHQRSSLPAYNPARASTFNTDGWRRSNIPLAQTQCSAGQRSSRLVSTQMNAVTQPPPPPQSPRSSARINPARTRPPSIPSPSYRPLSNHTPDASPSSPDSFHPRGRPHQPLPASSPHPLHSIPARVSANLPETPTAVDTPAQSHPSHSHVATFATHQSPPRHIETHRSRVGTEATDDEPPPAYTPIQQ